MAKRHGFLVLCLAGLALGLLAGIALRQDPETANTISGVTQAVIRAWTNAFRVIVPFLVVSQLYLAIAGRRPAPRDATKLGLLIPAVFVGLWAFIAMLAFAVMRLATKLPIMDRLSLSGLDPGAAAAGAAPASAAWVDALIPPDLLLPSSSNMLLPLMLFTMFFALAARRLAPEPLKVLEQGATAIRDSMFVLVAWLVRAAPLILLVVGMQWSGATLVIGGVLLAYLILKSSIVLLGTGSLYVFASVAGRCSPARFARALVPAQLTAITTRSSLAAVPALLSASDRDLGIPSSVSALVIPLAGATLKLSQAVAYSGKLFFLAHILGVHLTLEQVLVFMLMVIPLAISTSGVPRVMSGERSAPAYATVGIAPQYVLLLGTVTGITDALETLFNATGYMAANVLVARFAPGEAPEATRYPAPAIDSPSAAERTGL